MIDAKLLHGENLAESRRELALEIQKTRQEGLEVIVIEAKKSDLTNIRSALESNSLFGKEKLIVLENFFSLPDSSFKRKTLVYFKKGQFHHRVLFWEEKTIQKIPLTIPARLFRLDPALFRFLDNLCEGSKKENLERLAQAKEKEKPEMIFFMIRRQIRLLILAADLGEKGLSGLAPWQKGKLLHQAKQFHLDHLLTLYGNLLNIDYEQKTSRDPFKLYARLDLFVAEI